MPTLFITLEGKDIFHIYTYNIHIFKTDRSAIANNCLTKKINQRTTILQTTMKCLIRISKYHDDNKLGTCIFLQF